MRKTLDAEVAGLTLSFNAISLTEADHGRTRVRHVVTLWSSRKACDAATSEQSEGRSERGRSYGHRDESGLSMASLLGISGAIAVAASYCTSRQRKHSEAVPDPENRSARLEGVA